MPRLIVGDNENNENYRKLLQLIPSKSQEKRKSSKGHFGTKQPTEVDASKLRFLSSINISF